MGDAVSVEQPLDGRFGREELFDLFHCLPLGLLRYCPMIAERSANGWQTDTTDGRQRIPPIHPLYRFAIRWPVSRAWVSRYREMRPLLL